VWATRIKLDGRCDYRKEQGNSPKRSLSPQNAGREPLVTVMCVVPPYWVMPTDWGKLEIVQKRRLGYATTVVTSSLNFFYHIILGYLMSDRYPVTNQDLTKIYQCALDFETKWNKTLKFYSLFQVFLSSWNNNAIIKLVFHF
jgi:hypothetical protein